MRATFKKEKYFDHMFSLKDPLAVKLYEQLNEIPSWVNDLNNRDLYLHKVELEEELKKTWETDYIYYIYYYDDFSEFKSKVGLHEKWLENLREN